MRLPKEKSESRFVLGDIGKLICPEEYRGEIGILISPSSIQARYPVGLSHEHAQTRSHIYTYTSTHAHTHARTHARTHECKCLC